MTSLQITQLRLQSAPTRAFDWINQNMIDYGTREILDPIRNLGRSRKEAQSFLDAWRLEKTGFLKMDLVNDHPFADLLEYGWKDYDVFPKGKANGGSDTLKFNWKGGIHFSKHTHPRGFRGYGIIESAEQWGFFDRFLERILVGANQHLLEMKIR